MPRGAIPLSEYRLTERGRKYVNEAETLFPPIPYSASNARRILLGLIDDVEDGNDPNPERFWNSFNTQAPLHALKWAARELRFRGLLEPLRPSTLLVQRRFRDMQ